MKKKHPNETKLEVVYTETDLKTAIKEKYGTILVKGEVAKAICKNIDTNPKLRKLSNLSIIGGLFLWPLLLVGIAGRILTATDFQDYKITKYTQDELTLTRK